MLECFCIKHSTLTLLPSTYVCYISKHGYKKIVRKPDKIQGIAFPLSPYLGARPVFRVPYTFYMKCDRVMFFS